MSAPGTLKIARLCSLFLCFVFAVVGFSVGLNGLLKANGPSDINRVAFPDGIIDIGIYDVFVTGAVVTAICALLTLLSGVFCASTWCLIKTPSFFRIQSWALFFCAAWLFATLVAYDYFFASRPAQITTNFRGDLPTPGPVIQRRPYRDVYFLLLAVIPWFAFVLAIIAGVVLQLAASRAATSASNTGQNWKHGRIGP